MSFTSSSLKASATFNGNYNDIQGHQDNRHSRTFRTINSTFTTIGGDQVDSRSYTIHIHASTSGTSLPHLIQTAVNSSNLVGGSDGLPVQIQSHHQQAMVATDNALALIISIVHLLHTDSSDSYRTFQDMERFLKLLCDTISATQVALQLFEFTPLGQNLSTMIKATVVDCCENLQKMLDKLKNYRSSFSYTTVRSLWGTILCNGHELDELYAINSRLFKTKAELSNIIAAINSISWKDIGNELRNGAIPLQQFRTFLQHGPLRLQHIPLSRIMVVDHLGSNIPIPTMFCSTWQDFCYIINGYCRGRVGVNFVKQGDFELIRPEDNQTISPSKFVSAAQPGMVFEMSIVLRQMLAMLGSYETTCPRCRHVNDAEDSLNGWIECRRCSGQFQVAIDSRQRPIESQWNHSVGAERNAVKPSSTTEISNTDQEEVISPAILSDRITSKPSNNEAVDETQFFRRIRLLCNVNAAPNVPLTSLLDPVYDAAYDNIGFAANRCMVGTRVAILDKIMQWFDDDPNHPVCWLSGAAGSGKSAIARTLAEIFARRAILAASFFFFQIRDRGSIRRFIPTLAYQLSLSLPQTVPYFEQILGRDPSVVYQDTEHQFQKLILDPILSLPETIPTHIIIIDALDETNDIASIVKFIGTITLAAIRIPHFPFKFLFLSRINEHLRRAFESSVARTVTFFVSLNDDTDLRSDIRHFYRACFVSICEENPRLMAKIPRPWPSSRDIDELVSLSRGTFVFAKKIVDFVAYGNGHPCEKLKDVLYSQGQVALE